MIAGPWTLAQSVTTTGLQEWQTMDADGYTVSWRSLVTRGRDDISYTNAFLENWFTQLHLFLGRAPMLLSVRCGASYATRSVMTAMSSQEPGTIDETFSPWSAPK